MNSATLHPVTPTIPPDKIKNEFLKVAVTDNADPLWHFELALPKTARHAPPQKNVPQPGGEMVSLALFNSPQPPCDTEVFGQHLLYEIDPADWLDAWVEGQGFSVLSRKRLSTLGGAVGDLVVQWGQPPNRWMGRCFACKAGHRLVLIWFRTTEADYAPWADSFFLTLSHFQMRDESPGPLAEKVLWAKGSAPVAWRTAIPVSWKLQEEPATEGVSSFQATLLNDTGTPPSILGKLSMAIVRPDLAADPQTVLEKMLSAVRDAGAAIQNVPLAPETSTAADVQSWQSTMPASINGTHAELRCRILRHSQAWVTALVLGPAQAEAPWVWMRNKRVLDIAANTLELAHPT